MRAYKFKKLKRIHGVHFTPDGSRLLAVGGAEVRMVDAGVWLDLASGENVGRFDQFAHCYAVTPDLSRVALGGASNWKGGLAQVQWTAGPPACEWQQFAWAKRGVPPSYRDVSGLAFAPVGTQLAITHVQTGRRRAGLSSPARRLTVVDRDTGEARAVLPVGFEACVLRFSPDGSKLAATGGIDGDTRVSVFDVAAKRECLSFSPPATVTRVVHFLPDGRLAVANGRSVYLLPAAGGPTVLLGEHSKQVNAVAVTPDGTRLLSASHDGAIRTWDANTGASGPSFEWGIGPVTALVFSPDGLTCAAAGLSGNVVVWDVDG